jgi:hypothetical protein
LQLGIPKRAVWRGIHSVPYKTFWAAILYSIRNFIIFFWCENYGHENPDNNLESLYTMPYYNKHVDDEIESL